MTITVSRIRRRRLFLSAMLLTIISLRLVAAPAITGPVVTPRTIQSTSPIQSIRPLSSDELVGILKYGLFSMRELIKLVGQRGVDFHLTSTIETGLREVGAYDELIEAVRANFRSSADPASGPSNLAAYYDLLKLAVRNVNEKKVLDSATALENAIKLEPTLPTAYQFLGTIQLYLFRTLKGRDLKADRQAAETNMRMAIERGGEAMFLVRHNHIGFSGCAGVFVVRRSSVGYQTLVTYRSNGHSFEVEKSAIKKIDNSPDAFRITIPNPKKQDDTQRYLFVASDDFFSKFYPKLVLRLINEYQ